jgi:hypothetical protein
MKASLAMLMKTHVGKMPDYCLPTMLMKTINLESSSHDMYENKSTYRNLARTEIGSSAVVGGIRTIVGAIIEAGNSRWQA